MEAGINSHLLMYSSPCLQTEATTPGATEDEDSAGGMNPITGDLPALHPRWFNRACSLPAAGPVFSISTQPPLSQPSTCYEHPPSREGATAEVSASPMAAAAMTTSSFSEKTRSFLLLPPEIPRRRRSVSLECSRLESIAEENASLQKSTARRFSIPAINTAEG